MNMKSKMSFARCIFRGITFAGLAASVALAASSKSEKKAPGDFYEELSRLNKVLSEVNLKYVEDVDPAEVSEAAI